MHVATYKLQWSETEDKKKIPNALVYEVVSLTILITKAAEEKEYV